MKLKKRMSILAIIFAVMMSVIFNMFFSTALAEPSASNDIVVDVEPWQWHSTAATSVRAVSIGHSNSVTVTVTATDKATKKEVPVTDATVTLYVGAKARRTFTTDANGEVTISLEGMTVSELCKATISAYKVIDQTDAIDDVTRDALFNHFPQDTSGENIRLEYQLHSEKIDAAGNWIGESIPISNISNKADIVFVIDATGSMSSAINNVKSNIAAFSEALVSQGMDIRFSIVEYRDIDEGEETKLHTLNGNSWQTETNAVARILMTIGARGGGDDPESAVDALGLVAQRMTWRSDAYKFAFLLTDASYKNGNNYGYSGMDQLINDLVKKEIVTSVITGTAQKSTYSKLYSETGGIFANIYSSSFLDEMMRLAQSIVEYTTADMTLKLSEPRFLYNLSVCYLADDETSRSASYQNSVKRMLNEYAKDVAQATDGHVLINKILLMPTDSRMKFYTVTDTASMADIRIETRVKDDGTWWNNVLIHSNAYPDGFTNAARLSSNDSIDAFAHLKKADTYRNKETYARIQMSGIEGAGWNNSMIDDYAKYATTVTHESGHYLFGFFDEYMDKDKETWKKKNRPYSNFGLMDGQHVDIELSKAGIDYSYFGGTFPSEADTRHTYHSFYYREATEDTLAKVMESGTSTLLGTVLYRSPYVASYTKAKTADRNANYSYAELTDADYIILTGSSSISTHSLRTVNATPSVSQNIVDSLTETKISIARVDFDSDVESVTLVLTGALISRCKVYAKVIGEDNYHEYSLNEESGSLQAVLPVRDGDMAEVLIVDGTEYNRYYIDRYEQTDVGALYISMDGTVAAYTNSNGINSFTFIADNTGYTNGDYASVNQATLIKANEGIAFRDGEIYSVASYKNNIDYTSISWFKYADGSWKKLNTDCAMDEMFNIEARADLDGDGLYVLMAKVANTTSAKPLEDLKYSCSTTKDGIVTLSFSDPNTNSLYYNVYYAQKSFEYSDDNTQVMLTYPAEESSLMLDLLDRERTVYLAVEAVMEDGSRSPLSSMWVTSGTADSDGDGIPDWYCDENNLWPEDGVSKDIAHSDEDNDGLNNLEEYLGGSDPRDPNDPERTSVIPATSVMVEPNEVKMMFGQSVELKAIVMPIDATNTSVTWSTEPNDIITLRPDGNTCVVASGHMEGKTTIYVTSQDGGYVATCIVTVKEDVELPMTGDNMPIELLMILTCVLGVLLMLMLRKKL